MGYYVDTSGAITTSKPIKWQAVYSKNGYLTIWMADNYTTSTFGSDANYSISTARNNTLDIYNTLNSKFDSFSKIVATPQEASASWQYTQDDVMVYDSLNYLATYNGLQSNNSTLPNTYSWTSRITDKFWLPSAYEIFSTSSSSASTTNGLWQLDATANAFSTTTLSGSSAGYSWTRSANAYTSTIRAYTILSNGVYGAPNNNSSGQITNTNGIRPACHIDLKYLNSLYLITASISNADTSKATLDKNADLYASNSGTQHTFIYTANTGYSISKVTINGATVAISEIQPEEFAYAVGCKFKCFRDLQKVYVIVTECWEDVDIVTYCDIVFNTTTLTTDLKVVSSTATSNASTMDARIILEYNWSPNIRFSLDSGEWIKLVGNSGGGVVGSATYNFSRHEAKFYVIIEIYGLTQAVHNVQVDYYAGGASSITPSIYNNSGSATFEQYDDGNGISRIVVTPASGSYVYSMFIDNVEFPIEYYKAEVYGTGTATSIQYIAKDTNNTFIVLAQNVYKNMNIQFQLVQQVPELKVPPTTGASITGTVATANTGGEVRMVGSDTIEGETA